MTWEDAITKFASHPPDLTAMGVRPLSHSPTQDAHMFAQEPQEMDVDPVGSHQQAPAPGAAPRPAPPPIALAAAPPPPGRPLLSSDARIRTPLPSGPGSRHQHDKPLAMMSSGATLNNGGANHVQPNPNHAGGSHPGHPGGPPPIAPLVTGRGGNLQAAANRIFSNPYRSRYSAVQVLILYWQDEDDRDVTAAINDLAETFDKMYRYTFELSPIPTSAENCKSPWRWLSRKINDFVEHRDQRDVLKIVYYNGHSFLDANREMVLARLVLFIVVPCRTLALAHLIPAQCPSNFPVLLAAPRSGLRPPFPVFSRQNLSFLLRNCLNLPPLSAQPQRRMRAEHKKTY